MPGKGRLDRVIKRRAYQKMALPEYWIVDPHAQTIERWRPEDIRPEILDSEVRWQPPGVPEPFVLDIPALFREVFD